MTTQIFLRSEPVDYGQETGRMGSLDSWETLFFEKVFPSEALLVLEFEKQWHDFVSQGIQYLCIIPKSAFGMWEAVAKEFIEELK